MQRGPSSRGVATGVLALVCMLSMTASEASAQPSGGGLAPWTHAPSVLVVSYQSGDLHLAKTRAAVAFWNRELAAMGTPFRLGSVTQVASQSGWSDYAHRRGSIVVVFSTGGGGISNAHALPNNQGGVVHLRIGDGLILTHELGHAIGLGHSTNRESVMFGPVGFGGLRLTADDKAKILAMYPSRQARR
jgi:hypothetical protein